MKNPEVPQPSFVEAALQILTELGDSPVLMLPLKKFTTVNMYAHWCAQNETQKPESAATIFYSQKDCAAMLHISIPTIIDYRKKGWLVGRRLGSSSKILFTQADIDEAVKKIAIEKYKRA